MKLKYKISISLILMIVIYIILSMVFGGGSKVFAGNYVSMEEAERMCPGITNLVNSLKSSHSEYNFQFYNVGIEWNEVILREYQGHGHSPYNLFSPGTKYSGMWYCPICGTAKFDNGLCCASMDALRYMIDPRNSINEESVFQFKNLETGDVTYDDVARVVAGTFLNDAECINAIVEASQSYNVNGYFLVAKILTEQGTNGSTLSRGVQKNGITYYNFFNIGASGNGASKIIENGTNYAANAGWNTKRLSILGGAQVVRSTYIGRGQNTCYYQKFNVVNTESGLFKHQYAQSILSAENEGRKFRTYYNINGNIVGNHNFIIPVYPNMPATAVSRPSTATKNVMAYETAVVTANGGLKVRARQAINSEQIGTVAQNTTVKVIARAEFSNASDGYYWDWIISDATGVSGYVARNYITKTGGGVNGGDATDTEYSEPTPEVPTTPSTPSEQETPPAEETGEKIAMSGRWLEMSPSVSVEELLEKYPNAIITDTSGNITKDIRTGYNIEIDGASYSLVKKGDVNCDGKVNVLDVVQTLNHIKEDIVITDETRLEAAKAKCNERVTVTDVVKLLNYIKEVDKDILIK